MNGNRPTLVSSATADLEALQLMKEQASSKMAALKYILLISIEFYFYSYYSYHYYYYC